MTATKNDPTPASQIGNPGPLGYPWRSPDSVTDDPEARLEELPCGCYSRIDGEKVLCTRHLDALNDRCSFQPEDWGEWPGIDGLVLLCNTHGHPGIGVYDFAPGEAVGSCHANPTESTNGATL